MGLFDDDGASGTRFSKGWFAGALAGRSRSYAYGGR